MEKGMTAMDASEVFDLEAFNALPLSREPYEHVVLAKFVKPEALAKINQDYPSIAEVGSFPLDGLKFGPGFQAMVDALESEEFRKVFEKKFSVDLTDRPSTITVRGRCGTRDGNIHTDSATKIITILLYINSAWDNPGGRLRLLRSGNNIEDFAVEVPPAEGTLVAFLRSDHSWHGHLPFIGERRVIQFNWVTDKGSQKLAMIRHGVSSAFKRAVRGIKGSKADEPTTPAEM
jgi:SM-20-related protein